MRQTGLWGPVPLVVIGASAGGPDALAIILSGLPENFHGAVIIVQHVDEEFSANLAEWLNRQTSLPVRLAPEGGRPMPGGVYVAGTNNHLILTSDLNFSYISQPSSPHFHPSVDIFFNSVLDVRSRHLCRDNGCVGILLSGMGRDGAAGLLQLREAGWHTIAQDETTSAVYGMPKAAHELGAAMRVLPIGKIAQAIMTVLGRRY